jgi:hypothetical protein
LQVEGQKLVGGGDIEVRDKHSLRVLLRQADGSWLIASEMYNDANREQTYEGALLMKVPNQSVAGAA